MSVLISIPCGYYIHVYGDHTRKEIYQRPCFQVTNILESNISPQCHQGLYQINYTLWKSFYLNYVVFHDILRHISGIIEISVQCINELTKMLCGHPVIVMLL